MKNGTTVIDLPRLVSVSEAARALDISPYLAERLPVRRFRLGRSTFLAADDLTALFDAAPPSAVTADQDAR